MDKVALQKAVQTYLNWIQANPALHTEDEQERAKRKAYFQSWTANRLEVIDSEGLLELLSQLWALKSWGNKQYVIERLIQKTGLEKLRQNLADLLHGSGTIDKRWDRFSANVNGMGPAIMSELLCHIHPTEFMVWNSKAYRAFQNLGITNLPRYNYQMTGERYQKLCGFAAQIRTVLELACGRPVDLLEVNYFMWSHLQEAPTTSAPEEGDSHFPPADDIIKTDEKGFIHNEIRDKLRDIGLWLGFQADTEIKVASGSVVDTIWEATIGNMGRVIYVFEVQTRGSIDSLILNLLKALNNAAVQGVVAVSDQKQLEKIKRHVEEVGGLTGKLRYWDYRQVLEIHEALSSVNEAINDLDLVPQSLYTKRRSRFK